MKAYLDSTIILRIILQQPNPHAGWRDFESLVGSQLVEVECLRTLDRMRVAEGIPEDILLAYRMDLYEIMRGIDLFQPTPPILRRASETFPVAIGTLGAIHLSTALSWKDEQNEELSFLTHDKGLGKAAQALGFKAEGF